MQKGLTWRGKNRMWLRKAKGRTGLSNALFQVYIFSLSLELSTNQDTRLVLNACLMDGCMVDGWMSLDGWVCGGEWGRWVGGWMDGWMDGWISAKNVHIDLGSQKEKTYKIARKRDFLPPTLTWEGTSFVQTKIWFSFIACSECLLFFLNLFIYLFMAVLGLRFCVRAFSSCDKRGPLFIAVRGPLTIAASRCGAQAPDAQAQ